MYKELIQICKGNVQSLKSQIGMCEAQITFGTKMIKNKYKKIQNNLQMKLDEETFWYMKYVVLQKLYSIYGDTIKFKSLRDSGIKSIYDELTPEDVEMCSEF